MLGRDYKIEALKKKVTPNRGRRRNPVDWTYNNIPAISITSRGFTMHEHMDNFKLINMNGRVYDPVMGQFLSPDPFFANSASTMSYNRYAYCNYNPLKYVDPSGYKKTNRYLEPMVIVNAWPMDIRSFVEGRMRMQQFGTSNPKASLEAAFQSEHTFVSDGNGGGQWVTNDKLAETIWNSEYGGGWSDNGAAYTFANGTDAMIWGLAYTEYFNAWGNTVNGSLAATIEDYSIRTNTSNLVASLDGPEGGEGGASDWVQTKTDQLWYLGYGTSFISICSGKDVPFVTKLSGKIGKTTGLLNLFGTYSISESDGYISWGDKLRIGVASAEYFGTNYFVNPWITVPSLVISVIDAAGGFDNWYDAWDQSEKMYLETGVTILPINMPHNGMPIIIHK